MTSVGGGTARVWAGDGGRAGDKASGVAGAFLSPKGILPGAALGGFIGSMDRAIAGAWAGQPS